MPESLEVSVHQEGRVGIVETNGYINNIGAENISEVCDELMQNGTKHFLFNLAASRIINSIGISILIEVIEKVRETEGAVGFSNVTPTIAKTFRIMGLLKYSTVYDSMEEGLETLAND
jgi:anti-anti-sigma factor